MQNGYGQAYNGQYMNGPYSQYQNERGMYGGMQQQQSHAQTGYGYGNQAQQQETQPAATEKDWLATYASTKDYHGRNEYEMARSKMLAWQRNTRISRWLDWVIYGYILAILVYIGEYWVMNGGPVPDANYSFLVPALVAAGIGVVFAVIYGLMRARANVEDFTVGTLGEMAPHDKKWYAWVQLSSVQLPFGVWKYMRKRFENGERVIIFTHDGDDRIHIEKLYTKREARSMQMQQQAVFGRNAGY